MDSRRLIYSTQGRAICGGCGWPETDCRCSSRAPAPDEKVPAKISVRLRIEHRGGGKSVTLIEGLPRNRPFLDALAKELKRSCGSGGHAGVESVELQGDLRDRARTLLTAKGWTVKS